MMKYRTKLLIGFIFSNMFFCAGQQSVFYESVPIYEIGEPVTNCDINMKNLLNNWVSEKIVNANEYDFLEWSFVETLSDSSRYAYYRNYFSGTEPVYNTQRGKSGYSYPDGKEYDSLWVYPGFIHSEFYDTRGLPDEAQTILSEDVRLNAKDILFKELNIDTVKLIYHFYYKTDSIESFQTTRNGFDVYNKSAHIVSHNIASIDSLSENYIDVVMKKKKSYHDLAIEELRELLLEELLIGRIVKQLSFNEKVEIGDKVYVIKFKHKEKFYNNYIVCSSETNKVVMDYFFSGITLKNEK
ncbi:MAG: hypothetical protein LBQ60_15565 [Bacteroidales bacterium]|jgi:hypothetical protein|nr:hypothetical protein [Bacteroidales bacterium]